MVKAFNTLSAWTLQNGPLDANRQVTGGVYDVEIMLKPKL